ncbi:tripartite tricarboxylate transporter TctB family protein [Brevibacillus nitrificans]|uniref:tripartite tricarboxylate transporter TctB family protein n=1 Tax=Brevibacillus nitrificans TaxID=651560 RepID=UPI002622F32B|nr:tripartite tricarboxylate transporter TctB family protein [Brevibacillus nitrificans]
MIRPRNLPDLIGALLFMALGIIVSVEAYRLESYATSVMVGDHTLPFLLGIVLVVLGAVLLLQALRGKGKKGTTAVQGAAGTETSSDERKRILLCLGALFLYVVLLYALGYWAATLIASFLLFRLIGFYRWLTSFFFSILLTGCLYGVFIFWLQITFPSGFLFD